MHKTSFPFEKSEFNNFLLSVFVMSLVFFFFVWRTTDFNFIGGLGVFVVFFIFTFVISFIARWVQKFAARKRGYQAVFKNTWQGMAVTIAISFFSFGLIPLLSPGRIQIIHDEKARLGKFRYGFRYKDMSFVAIMGIVTYVVLVFLLKIFFSTKNNELVNYLTMIGALIAGFSILPIPTFEGINILAHSRLLFFFFFVFVVAYGALLWFTNLYTIIIPLFVAILLTAGFLYFIEDKQF